MVLTLEFRHSEQQLRTHILEAKWFMQDRGLETHSLWMPFLPWKKKAFLGSCMLRITHCLKVIFQWQVPWCRECWEGSVPICTGKIKTTSISIGLFHHVFFCRRDLVSLGLSGIFLDSAGSPCDSNWIQGLGAKIHIFLLGDPKEVQPSNFL